MITKLIEDGKRKAHQYWPDDTDGEESLGHVYELGGGIRVEHLSSSFQVLVVLVAVIVVLVDFVVEDYRPVYFTCPSCSRGLTSSEGSASNWPTGHNARSFSSTRRSGRILQPLMSPGLNIILFNHQVEILGYCSTLSSKLQISKRPMR